VSKYAEPWAATLSGLKTRLEEQTTMDANDSGKRPWTASANEKVFEIYIRTTPERLWEAITDGEMRPRYSFGLTVISDWQPGSGYELSTPAGETIATGENLEIDPPRKLVQSFAALWSDDVKREGISRVTWDIEPVGDSCRLTVTHDQLREGAHGEVYGGWPQILSGLKTLLETGEQLTTPGSLLYARNAPSPV
jgi:uncharacterized protein YndB with AHSA1/START domain